MVSRSLHDITVRILTGVRDRLPDWESMYDTSVTDGLYDGTTLVWPA